MNSKSADNGQPSRWKRLKNRIQPQATLPLLVAFIGLSVAIIGLSAACIFNYYRSCHYERNTNVIINKIESLYKGIINSIESKHKDVIENIKSYFRKDIQEKEEEIRILTDRNNEFRNSLEKLRKEDKIASLIPVPKEIPASKSSGSINAILVDSEAKQFIVTVKFDKIPQEKAGWIGTQSGLQFWPQIELPSDIKAGQSFKYRVTIPPGIASGELALMEAGPQANRLFKQWMVSQYYQIGLFVPHLQDAQMVAAVSFP